MRPIKLKMKAFGSFSYEEELDFTGYTGLWLISGDTGSGKTTIFDAIAYALYGMTSNNEARNGKQLRSNYADPTTPTEVSLAFEHDGKEYTVIRSPEYMRRKERGNGLTKSPAKASLLSADGKELASGNAVAEWVVGHLGIDYRQFIQLVLIAQGDFMKIVRSDTDTREKLLRPLFHTQRFADLTEKLQAKQSEAKTAFTKANGELSGIAKAFVYDNESIEDARYDTDSPGEAVLTLQQEQLDRELAACQEKDAQAQQLRIAADNARRAFSDADALHRRFADLEKVQKKIREDLEKKPEMDELQKAYQQHVAAWEIRSFISRRNEAVKAKEIRRAKQEEAIKTAGNAAEAFEKAKEKAKTIPDKTNTRDELLARSEQLKSLLDKYADMGELSEQLKNQQTRISAAEDRVKEQNKVIRDTDDQITAAGILAGMLADRMEDTKEKENARKDIEQQKAALKRILEMEADLSKETAELNCLEEVAETAKKAASQAADSYQATLQKYIAQQAYRMAKDLVDGQECPVCGNIHHPRKAILFDETEITDEDLKAVEKKKNEADSAAREAQSKADSGKNAVAVKQEEVCEARKAQDIDGETGAAYNEMDTREQNAIAEAAAAQQAVDESKQAATDLIMLQEKRKVQDAELEDRKGALQAEKDKQNSLMAQIQLLQDELKGRSQESAEAEKQEIDSQAEALRVEISDLQNVLTNAESSNKTAQNAMETAKREYRDAAEELTAAQNDVDEAIRSSCFDTEQNCLQCMPGSQQVILEEQRTLTAYQTSRNTNTKALSDLMTELEGKTDVDPEPLREAAAETEQTAREAEGTVNVMNTRLDAQQKQHRNLENQLRNTASLRKTYQMYSDLYAAISGKNDAVKLSLERYVQRYYYQRVIERANLRLRKMTDNMFELSLREPNGTQGQQGLDLDVTDFQTGEIRAASTLSGGESFKAALALALGMADIIGDSTNVHIDAMFIDEGFGTLDDNSLNQALNVLMNISETDHRMIGVISHRPEMRERIMQKVYVRKTDKGSVIDQNKRF